MCWEPHFQMIQLKKKNSSFVVEVFKNIIDRKSNFYDSLNNFTWNLSCVKYVEDKQCRVIAIGVSFNRKVLVFKQLIQNRMFPCSHGMRL